ncbi:MAG: isoprenylcysteine carboxylmethyltransferase family protein [Planctomycetes bacterium]|nr:isoprenylcysteine carboxylmethyltransferase family protein [Planctomycetota bacterium]
MSTHTPIRTLLANGSERASNGVGGEENARRPETTGVWVYDVVERVIVLLLYLGLVARMLAQAVENGWTTNLLLLPSEGLVVVLLLIRRPTTQISRDAGDWALALAATMVPLMVQPVAQTPALISPLIPALLYLCGMIIQLHAKWILGRSFGCVPAHRGLKQAGPYRIVRHPIYAGYLLAHVAFLMMNPSAWNALVYLLAYALQIPRLLIEERLLAQDPEYQKYQMAVRYRLIPGVY